MSVAVDPRFTPEGLVTLFLVLGGWSLLWKDNLWCRVATNILMAASAGNLLLVSIGNIRNLALTPLSQGTYVRAVPLILGLLVFARYYKKISFVVRYPMSLLIGVGTGLMVVGRIDTMILRQIATLASLFKAGQTPFVVVSYVVFIVTFITSLYFFIFSLPFTGFKQAGFIQRIGRWSLMTMLGLYFGSTVLNRLSMTLPAVLFMLLGIRTG